MELPDDCSKFLANQLAFTYDLIKKGNKLTPGYLGILLANKTFGIADLVLGKRFDCGFAILFLGSSLTKAALFTSFTGPGLALVTAAELLSECYNVDKTCGISEAVSQEIDKATRPAYMWLEQGVMDWLSGR